MMPFERQNRLVRRGGIVASLLACCLVAHPQAWAQTTKVAADKNSAITAEAFTVSGAVGKPGAWTVDKLTKEFAAEIKTIDYTIKGTKGQAKCVSLLSILKVAEPRLNPKAKNHLLSFVAFVRAADGYTISFSLGELQPDVGKRDVWIALDRNGQPLPGDDGPVELIVTEDAKPARWVHSVARIVLMDGIAATEQTTDTPSVKEATKP